MLDRQIGDRIIRDRVAEDTFGYGQLLGAFVD